MDKEQKILQKSIAEWQKEYPQLTNIMELKPLVWLNSSKKEWQDIPELPVNINDITEAERLWHRFAPYLAEVFPETKGTSGIIESPLRKIQQMKEQLKKQGKSFSGELYLKCDNDLPIAGSIKARGGVYEVLKYAENLAIEEEILTKHDNYEILADKKFRNFFSNYAIGVGSTGNLALSIGIIGVKLGFNVSVYMSADAKQWKKDLLREKGANVYEFAGDFSSAIKEGRIRTDENPYGYFIDDENSKDLFLGYSVAALRLKNQLYAEGIKVDKEHPLFVYLPCGVGGSPGGITFGLKQVFGDHVHCFYVEPTHSPSVLLGLLTGAHSRVSVQDFGIDNKTGADGLAVGRPSSFATAISQHLVSGVYTIEDEELYKYLALLADAEDIYLEPSAASGLIGPERIETTEYAERQGLEETMKNATHIAWATGGSFVPEKDRKLFYQKGKDLL